MLVRQRTAEVAGPVCPIPTRLEDMTLDILCPWQELQEKAREFFALHGRLFDMLGDTVTVRHLCAVMQFGIKQHGQDDGFRHSRWLHSQHVAAHNIAVGIKLGLSSREVLVATFGALLHDIGYGAWSHDGDHFLGRYNFPGHEERSSRIILEDAEIGAVLREACVHPHDVHAVTAETGMLGQLQRFSDTGAYVVLDSLVCGYAVPSGMSSRYVDSIVAVTGHEIIVNSRRPLAWAIARRGELGRAVYFSPENKLRDSANIKVLEYVYGIGGITLDEVVHGGDAEVAAKVLRVVESSPSPQWLRSLARLIYVDYEAEIAQWHSRSCALRIETATNDPSAVVVYPWDYTQKAIRVRVGRNEARLQASSSLLRDCDRLHYVYSFAG